MQLNPKFKIGDIITRKDIRHHVYHDISFFIKNGIIRRIIKDCGKNKYEYCIDCFNDIKSKSSNEMNDRPYYDYVLEEKVVNDDFDINNELKLLDIINKIS
jgi:hypothetical protein